MIRRIILGASALLLLGCATSSVDRKVPTGFSHSAKCAVVAFVNDPVKFEYVGVTVFTNETKAVSLRQIDIAGRIEHAVVDRLKPMLANRVEVLKLDNRSTLEALLFTPTGDSHPPTATFDAIRQLREAAAGKGFNCLITILPAAHSSAYHPMRTDGLGFIGRLTWSYAYFSGVYQIASLTEGRAVAAGFLKTDPNSNFLTAKGPPVLAVRVDSNSYLDMEKADSVALNEKTVNSLLTALPEMILLIAANVADALSSSVR